MTLMIFNISNNSLWLYHLPSQSWYRWPNLSCESLTLANDEDKLRFYIGTNDGRVGKTFTDQLADTSTSGDDLSINMKLSTGNILINPLPQQIKAFKKFSLIYRRKGVHTVTVTIKIDKFPSQVLSFTDSGANDLLGTTFVLGVSLLGEDPEFAAYTQSICGYGRAINITIEQSGTNDELEVQGFSLEYEDAGTAQEVNIA